MGWIAAAVGAASVATSLYGAISGNKIAEKNADNQYDIASRQQAISEAQWNRYLKTFAPIEDKLAAEASAPVADQPGFAKMMAGVDKGYADARANIEKSVPKSGQYGGGLTDEKMQGLDLSHIRARAGAFADANQNRFGNMMAMANMGRGLPNNAVAGFQSAGSQFGNLANMYANSSASAWNSLGNTAGNMAQLYLMNKKKNDDDSEE